MAKFLFVVEFSAPSWWNCCDFLRSEEFFGIEDGRFSLVTFRIDPTFWGYPKFGPIATSRLDGPGLQAEELGTVEIVDLTNSRFFLSFCSAPGATEGCSRYKLGRCNCLYN